MQIAYRAQDIAEAHIIAGMLQASGIEAFVGGHYLQGALGEIGASGFSNVHVGDEDYLKARDLIDQYEAERSSTVTEPSDKDGVDRVNRYALGFLIVLAIICGILVGAL